MTDLTEFLLARIAEDEAAASRATAAGWTAETHYHRETGEVVDAEVHPVVEIDSDGSGGIRHPPDAEHVARWNPARVLAECVAKRGIVVEWEQVSRAAEADPDDTSAFSGRFALGLGIRHLANVYSHHPDYDETWLLP